MKCALCGSKFTPEKNQKKAQWAATWCEIGSGLLCPPCQLAAGEVEGGTALKSGMTLGCLPFGSDILKKSKACTKEVWEKRRGSESWRTWVEGNHPEWL
jgi:rubredoxin